MRALPPVSVMGRSHPLSDCQVAVAPLEAPSSLKSERAAVLLAPVAVFQLAFGTTPAVSPAPIGVPVPTKSMLMARALELVFDSTSCVVALCTSAPLVPVTVMVYVPVGVEEVVAIWSVELPEPPLIDGGVKPAVAPLGRPDALSVTVPLNPFTGTTLTG